MQKSEEYLRHVAALLTRAAEEQLPAVEALAGRMAETLGAGRTIFLFGTGHSSLLAQELFYRAGGLVRLQPMLESALMLHESASKSTEIERLPEYAAVLMAHYQLGAGDLLILISNSGRNPLCVELALRAKAAGCAVVALTNRAHSLSGASRHASGRRLLECADLVLDNLGCPGDACIGYENFAGRCAPTSTVVGAALLQAAVARVVELQLEAGETPEVFASSNIDGGDAVNQTYLERYKGEIRFL
ncbi:MAG: SIS domain-containing protein [Oscillospiraceae bacterium]|nr:SIS domain-containing protein [Oscillospiraceae bacterium]